MKVVCPSNYKTTPCHNPEDNNNNPNALFRCGTDLQYGADTPRTVTLAHITHIQFFVHLRGETGPIGTTFPNQSFHKCAFRHAYLHGCIQNAHYCSSALRGSLPCPPLWFVYEFLLITALMHFFIYLFHLYMFRASSAHHQEIELY